MRTLKFRIWDKENKRMLFSSEPKEQTGREYVPFVFGIGWSDWEAAWLSELMQFTGLLDYHNQEIYEGDVVQITELYGGQQQAEVFWGPVANSYQWMNGETWLLRFTSGAEGPLYPYCRPVNQYELEVIGNIHEHPDLLREGGAS